MKYVDVRGVWPTYVSGVTAIQLRYVDRNISIEKAMILANALSKTSQLTNNQEHIQIYKEHLKQTISWWQNYRSRNAHLDPDTHVLDKVGTINGVISNLEQRLSELSI